MKSHHIIILDRSGSMESCRDATIAGFNELLQTVNHAAATAGAELFVTLVVFNDEIGFIAFCERAEWLLPLDRETYVPDRTTAMLDAVGLTLRRFVEEVPDDPETSYLVTIVSDGAENASRHYSYSTIAKMIDARQRSGRWTFAYMGANQDLEAVSERTHIPRGNTAAFSATPDGSRAAFGRLAYSSGRTFIGVASSGSFFDESDPNRDGSSSGTGSSPKPGFRRRREDLH